VVVLALAVGRPGARKTVRGQRVAERMLGDMEIRRFGPDERDTVSAAVELVNAVAKTDAPFVHPSTPDSHALTLRHGWDGEVPDPHGAWEDDRLVGLVTLHTSEWDNVHVAWVELLVHPDVRREGRGSALLEYAEARTRELGRTSIGLFGWDNEATRGFGARHALPCRSAAVMRRQALARLDRTALERTYAEAAARASDYELVRIQGRTPDDMLKAVAEMTAAINDAPIDELDIEDEAFPPERVAAYEAAQVARGRRLYRVVARHRASGELAGHTVVVVEADRPHIGEQHDTSVVAAHRGHRLGLLLKADMLRWLAGSEPQLATVDTWNTESNRHMIGINEKLGYQVLGRELQLQRSL
jgi:GNAT superfamily N-acetyltransferase